ncbi:hypothetical protein ACI2K4_30685 [Micromonospora sp. NPDC050397]|uniref:hypothetical protein n=1 Tax=Micromonospora sp. NPDC050397 TaxID=3364279 RepID=UPI00384C15D9
MTATDAPSSGPAWVQILLSVVGVLGGTAGVFATVAVAVRRRRFEADPAELLTSTALTIVGPLRGRVSELELETARARGRALAAEREISELRVTHRDLTTLLHRWRTAIMAPDATMATVRAQIRANRSLCPDEQRSPSTCDG